MSDDQKSERNRLIDIIELLRNGQSHIMSEAADALEELSKLIIRQNQTIRELARKLEDIEMEKGDE